MSQMMPEDLMGLLGGGGAPQGPLPPDISALLGGGGEAPSVVDGSPGGGEGALTQAIDLIQAAIDAESDQEDVQVMLQCQAKLQAILAKNQSEADAALGGKVNPKAIRKQAAGAY